MILAGKAYYDGVAKIGEIATGSPVSTELGELTIHFYTHLACCPGRLIRVCQVAQSRTQKGTSWTL